MSMRLYSSEAFCIPGAGKISRGEVLRFYDNIILVPEEIIPREKWDKMQVHSW